MYEELYSLVDCLKNAENQSSLEQVQYLLRISKLSNELAKQYTQADKHESWMLRAYNVFMTDLRQFLDDYSKQHDIPLQFRFYLVGRHLKRKLDITKTEDKYNAKGFAGTCTEEATNKAIVKYLGLDKECKSLTQNEYEAFIEKKSADTNYPACMIPKSYEILQKLCRC